jgi:hypothetical protein
MKYIEDVIVEVKILDDGAVFTRRKDGKPMTPADYKEALRLADSLPGIDINDVLRVFPGAKVRQHRGNER